MENNIVRKVFGGWFSEEKVADEPTPTEEEGQEKDQNGGSRQPLNLSSLDQAPLGKGGSFQAIGTTNLYDPAYEAAVREAIEKANFPGNDYFEFAGAVNDAINDKEEPKTERAAFKDCFKLLRSVDKMFSIDVLISSSDKYIQVVRNLKDQFASDSDTLVRNTRQDLDAFMRDMEKPLEGVDDKEAAVELKKGIEQMVNEWMEKAVAHQEGRQAKMNFHTNRVIEELQKDQQRIQTLLGNTTANAN